MSVSFVRFTTLNFKIASIFILILSSVVGTTLVEAKGRNKVTPELTITSPSNRDTVDTATQIVLSGTAVDPLEGDISHEIDWHSNIDGRLSSGATVEAELTVGKHTITATVRNNSNGSARSRVTLFVESNSPVNSAPQISILSPSIELSFDSLEAVVLTGTALDSEDGDLSAVIQWHSDVDGNLGMGDSISAMLTPGEHLITASVSDSENLSAEASSNITVELKTNNEPTLTILSPENNSQYMENTSVSFSASANDIEDGALSDGIVWVSSINGTLGTGANIEATLSAGTHQITATAQDSANAIVNETIALVIQNDAVGNNNAEVSWSAPTENTDNSPLTDLSGFKVYFGTSIEQMEQFVDVTDSSATSAVIENLESNRTYYFAVTAYNSIGHESKKSQISTKTFN